MFCSAIKQISKHVMNNIHTIYTCIHNIFIHIHVYVLCAAMYAVYWNIFLFDKVNIVREHIKHTRMSTTIFFSWEDDEEFMAIPSNIGYIHVQ